MSHPVICCICGKRFDRDKIQAVRLSARRYAHYECSQDGELVPLQKTSIPSPPKNALEEKIKVKSVEQQPSAESEENKDLRKLTDYIEHLYGKGNVNWPLVMKQVQRFKTDYGYSYSGMLKSLIYFYEIKNNHAELSRGVGIIPYTYKDAYNYYYSLFVAQSQNEQKNFEQITSKVREIVIKPPKIEKKQKMFNEDGDNE